jgi:hypothetical protein
VYSFDSATSLSELLTSELRNFEEHQVLEANLRAKFYTYNMYILNLADSPPPLPKDLKGLYLCRTLGREGVRTL